MPEDKMCPETDAHKPLPGFISNIYYFTKITESLTLSFVLLSGTQGNGGYVINDFR